MSVDVGFRTRPKEDFNSDTIDETSKSPVIF